MRCVCSQTSDSPQEAFSSECIYCREQPRPSASGACHTCFCLCCLIFILSSSSVFVLLNTGDFCQTSRVESTVQLSVRSVQLVSVEMSATLCGSSRRILNTSIKIKCSDFGLHHLLRETAGTDRRSSCGTFAEFTRRSK